MSAVKLGLIGCGRAAERLYLPALVHTSDVQVIAVSDPLPERRSLIAEQLLGSQVVTSAEELVQLHGLDGVIIATPPATHPAVARLAHDAHLAMLIEKPLAPTLREALEIADFCRGSDRPVMVGFNRRRWQAMERMRHVVQSGCVGPGTRVEQVMTGDISTWSPIAGPAGALEDLGSHQLDLLRFLFGADIATVAARQVSDTEFDLAVELTSGIRARILVGHAGRSQEVIRVSDGGRTYEARMGSVRITPASGWARRSLDVADRIARRLHGDVNMIAHSYRKQLQAFGHCIQIGHPATPAVADGVAAAAAVEAAHQSVARGGAATPVAGLEGASP